MLNITHYSAQFSSVQSLSRVQLFSTPWIAARQASLSITNSRSSPRLTSIKSVMPSSHLILCRPLLLLPPIPPSMSLFQWVNSSHGVAKVLQFQLQHHSFQRNPRADVLQNGLVGSPCSPRDSQESSPTQHFKSINSSLIIREMQIKTTMRYQLTLPVRRAIIKKSTNNKCWTGCGEKGMLLHCWWECKLIQWLWKMVWRFLKKN